MLLLHYAKNVAWEQRSLLGKVFSRQKSVYPFLTCTVLQVYTETIHTPKECNVHLLRTREAEQYTFKNNRYVTL